MKKKKVDFIADLLSNKALKVEHKERLFSLLSKELDKIGESDESIILKLKELEADIKQIKSKQATIKEDEEEFTVGEEEEYKAYTVAELLGEKELKEDESDETVKKRKAFWNMVSTKKNFIKGKEIDKQTTFINKENLGNEKTSNIKIVPPNPEATKNFLTYFRDSEGLKYLTHDFKDPSIPPERKTLLIQAKKEFEEALNKYPNTPIKLRRRIEEFAFKENPEWFIRRGSERKPINEGWCSKKFVEWFDSQKSPFIIHPCRSSKWNKLMIEPF